MGLRRKFGWLIVTAALVISGCGSAEESAGAPPSPFAAGDHPRINGEKDGVVIPVVNVWNTVPPSEALCTLRDNVAVTVTETKYNPADKHWWAKIDNASGCAGWVPVTSLKK